MEIQKKKNQKTFICLRGRLAQRVLQIVGFQNVRFGGSSIAVITVQWEPQCVDLPKIAILYKFWYREALII